MFWRLRNPLKTLLLSLCLTLLAPLAAKSPPPAKTLSPEERKIKSLYSTLDPHSIAQLLAFHELYPESAEGERALQRAWQLLCGSTIPQHTASLMLPKPELQGIIALVNRHPLESVVKLTEEQLSLVENIGRRLANRSLKGAHIWTQEALKALPHEEIDLSRALLIEQFTIDGQNLPEFKEQVRQYEASLDLMALQILARLPDTPSDEQKLKEMNRLIFHEMQFRFPPHSIYAKDVDLYTFLPSVIDNRRGVCLGVSILYLCLGQRLDLPLEIITPPGHIYVRYRSHDQILNIETTARGIHIPSEMYLGINTRQLRQRSLREVIGMAFVNQASVMWTKGDFETTVALYEKARPYLQEDPLLKMLLGFNYLFVGRKREGAALLKEIEGMTFQESVSPETLPKDYLDGKINAEGIKAVFMPVDATRESILAKQKEIQKILKRYPQYRGGLFQLATTWLQLNRGSEAMEVLLRYHELDSDNATVEYYLTLLAAQRMNYPMAWTHLKKTEALVLERNHYPRALADLREQLTRVCPEP